MYRVTLIDGANDLAFEFSKFDQATNFMSTAFKNFKGRETDDGCTKLAIEMETVEDEFIGF